MAGAGAGAEAGAKNKGERWSRKLIIYTDFNTFSWGSAGEETKNVRRKGEQLIREGTSRPSPH